MKEKAIEEIVMKRDTRLVLFLSNPDGRDARPKTIAENSLQ